MTLYPPFATLLRQSGATVRTGTRTYDEQTTAFLAGEPLRAGATPLNFGIGAVCDRAGRFAGLRLDGDLVSLDVAAKGITLPMIRAVFEKRGLLDPALGLREVFAYMDRWAPWP